MSHADSISLIIRTSNSERPLRRLLSQLRLGPGDEVVIVDTGSRDGTVALAKEAGAAVVSNTGPFNYSRTLNLGFAAAKNDWLLALSAHCVPIHDDFLEQYRVITQMPPPRRPAVVYGLQYLSRQDHARADQEPKWHAGPGPENQVRLGGNVNALYARDAWIRHPFDEKLKTGEDLEWKNWAADAGLISVEAPKAAVYYFHPGSPVYRFKKAWGEVRVLGPDVRPMTLFELGLGVAHATRRLLWESHAVGPWLGHVAHQFGVFLGSRHGTSETNRLG